MSPPRPLGIDVGGTKCLGVVLDADGAVAAEARRETPKNAHALIDTLAAIVDELGSAPAVGVGLPGLIDRGGTLVASAHLGAMAGLRLSARLEDRLGVPVRVGNDATFAAWAERTLGAGRGCDDMVMVTLGTGIGGGIVAEGRLVLGHNGFAGEFGHMVVDPGGPPCPCGRHGCWERYASGSGLARLARDAALGGRIGRVVELAGGDVHAVRGEHVQQAAREGDAGARAVVDAFARWVAVGLVNLTNALDPQAFVLGGGLAEGADLYLAPIDRWFTELLYGGSVRPRPSLRFAALGPYAGSVGAALLAAGGR